MQIVKNGTTYSFEYDIDKIVEYEGRTPDYSFFGDMASVGDIPKLSFIVRAAGFIQGMDFKKFQAQGFTVAEIVQILGDALEDLGFYSNPTE